MINFIKQDNISILREILNESEGNYYFINQSEI